MKIEDNLVDFESLKLSDLEHILNINFQEFSSCKNSDFFAINHLLPRLELMHDLVRENRSNLFYVEKPWGNYINFYQDSSGNLKTINVNPNSRLSLQYHNFRDEIWHVLEGKPLFLIDNNIYEPLIGESYFVPKGSQHRIMTKNSFAKVAELTIGLHDEEDIIRLEDDYHR